MIIKDLLLSTNCEDIFQAIYELHYINYEYKFCKNDSINRILLKICPVKILKEKKLNYIRKNYGAVIDSMLKMEPKIDPEYILLPGLYAEVLDYNEYFSVDLYKKKEIYKKFEESADFESIHDINILSIDELKEFIQSRKIINTYGYELTPRNEILGFEIDIEEFEEEDIFAPQILADILYETTFFGWEEDQVEEFGKSLKDSANEVKEVYKEVKKEFKETINDIDNKDNLSNEEKDQIKSEILNNKFDEKGYVSYDEFKEKFDIKDDRTDDEKYQDDLKMYRTSLKCAIYKYNVLQRFIQKHHIVS